jgi:hypothetical protein
MTATVEPRAEDGSIQSHRRSQRHLTASRCDGASATVDTVAVTSKAPGRGNGEEQGRVCLHPVPC